MTPPSRGFTVVELLVVLALVSLLLLFVAPRIPDNPLFDKTRKASVWITGTVRALKQKSVHEHRDYTLHINIDTGQLWVSHEAMGAEALLAAEIKAYLLPAGLRVRDVEFPGREPMTVGLAAIFFSKKGYADMALIHVEQHGRLTRSYLIEPFLPKVKIYAEDIDFSK
ncbi:MAG: prepilin-type N-terminal cleavage/methylation domain-containing protein [Desulfobacterales bacterium]|nr:prepilin-type N-terminal cleavage/methylation domain-containing protein [Desulfobacterales bacterium]